MSERVLPAEPRWLTEAALLGIHAEQIERYGGAHGILDKNVVLSALARPIHRWAYDPTADLADFAAAYLVGYARTQGFVDGNKRTGLACALVFLALNGAALRVPGPELYALTMAVANNQADDTKVARFVVASLAWGCGTPRYRASSSHTPTATTIPTADVNSATAPDARRQRGHANDGMIGSKSPAKPHR
jgi:death-on-curing protein